MMRLRSSENLRWYALGWGLAAALLLLGLLQYRSNRQLRDVLQRQMRATLQGSLMNVRFGIEQEFSPICNTLPSPPDSHETDLEWYAREFANWRQAAVHPALVANVFLYKPQSQAKPGFFQLHSTSSKFEATDWPEDFRLLQRKLEDMAVPGEAPARHEHRGRHGLRSPDSGFSLWLIDENIPALVHPYHASEGGHGDAAFLIIQLNLQELSQHILPELAQRYLGSNGHLDYQVALIQRGAARSVVYSSDPRFGGDDHTPDAQLNVFGPPMAPGNVGPLSASFGPIMAQHPLPTPRDFESKFEPKNFGGSGAPREAGPREFSQLRRELGPLKLQTIRYVPSDRGWTIIARHRRGSLEAAVAAVYHRNLAISFGVLLVLAGMISVIVMTTKRARRLAQLQLDFVTSVSHELRTPLTGIVSAAQNVADGLVDNKERAMRYGSAILGQAQQLSELIEQILFFSATDKGRHRYRFQAVEIPELVEASLTGTAGLIRSSGVRLEQTIAADLPQIWADFKALTQCLQNLIINAVKYGGESRWIGVRAFTVGSSNSGKEIVITIEDKGVGISPADLKNIFEPFYRSPAVTTAQIHGSGLGLSIAKNISEAMGGRLTVESEIGKGSSFSVHLPANKRPAPGENASESAPAEAAS